MNRGFNVGDRILCRETGVVGECIRFYVPTACEEQTMVMTDDGRRYHAPTRMWTLAAKVQPVGYEGEELQKAGEKMLNAYGEYALKFARNHGISVAEAMEAPMVKARKVYFDATGE